MYQEPQFVLVKYDYVATILATTDLDSTSTLVIKTYAHRFKIKRIFHERKQQIHDFSYHFRNSKVSKLNKYKKKSNPDSFMIERHCYLRTSHKGKVSVATDIDYLRKDFFGSCS